jgi:predicted dehydrogenase
MKKDLTRRKFLQRTAGAATALAAANTFFLPDNRLDAATYPKVAPSDRLRFGIIGIGMQGSGLLNAAVALPGAECIAAADLYDGRHTLAREITNKPDLPVTRRYHELLDNKDIDCLIAAVPDHWHKQVVVDACAAGKDIYCEKPMSHTAAEGVDMAEAQKKYSRIVQIGSQRVSSLICKKAKEMVASGMIGDLNLVEGWLGRNDPTGAWEYPPPFDLSPQTLDWDTWQGTVPKREFNPEIFARWRCWKEYGTGVAGDLLVHLVSGMMFVLGWNEAPKRAMAMGGILRWKDGRNMPDVHASLYQYGDIPVYMRLNLGAEMPEVYRFQGSKGILEMTEFGLSFTPQAGIDTSPSYYDSSFPAAMRAQYEKKWKAEHTPQLGHEPTPETISFKMPDYDDVKPHLWNFFESVRSRKPVVEDALFGHHAALACHMANESYFRGTAVAWDEKTRTIVKV